MESQAGSTPQRANQGTLPQSYCQSRGSMLRRANTASPAATSQHNTALAGLKDDKFLNAAGSTLWRANTASPAIVFKKNGPFSQQHKKRQTRIQKPGWLHAPACEPSQLGKWIQKAGMAARSGVRRQQARQLLNTTRRWQGSKTWRERENQKIWRVRLAPRPSVRTKAFFHRVTVKAVAPRSGVRRQPARQQLLNTTRRWQG